MSDQTTPQFTPLTALLLRLYWVVVGHAVVIMYALFIWMQQQNKVVIVNIVYFIIATLPIIARGLDIHYYKGETADGQPATISHWRRYSIWALISYAALWIAIQILASFVPV